MYILAVYQQVSALSTLGPGEILHPRRKSEWGGKLRACSRCSVAGKGVALYCSLKCQKDDWPRHKVQCNRDQDEKHAMPESEQKTIEDVVIWDRKNRPKLISAAISALELCHYPENADEYVFFVVLTDTPGAKHRYSVGSAAPISFEQYESMYGGDPRNDQRIGQERAKAKSATCISFQIVECASNDGCRNTFQTWMMPKDLHGYRTTGFGVLNWHEILLAQCGFPKSPVPPNQVVAPNFNKNLVALKAWRDLYMNDMYSATIDALRLDEDPSAGQKQFLIIYLRYTGLPNIPDMFTVENAFVFSLEEAAIMLDPSVWRAVELVVNGRPRTETRAAADPAPCALCQIIDPIDPSQAPSFTVPVPITDELLQGPRRKATWKQHLVETLGGNELRENMTEIVAAILY
ncbi:hypothetical protein B0H17DRAFT_183389 [Mycena rosella]|uniref:MYND-type domain-containing protein n=1 Tax=Mycena rosella TaxID=1033263 RepID=A0AAD7D1C5_MYCRO|nr:hypothetical protein B0H17DRAFT_183389 [Mycena rosella]